jgi:hypothetical protein
MNTVTSHVNQFSQRWNGQCILSPNSAAQRYEQEQSDSRQSHCAQPSPYHPKPLYPKQDHPQKNTAQPRIFASKTLSFSPQTAAMNNSAQKNIAPYAGRKSSFRK